MYRVSPTPRTAARVYISAQRERDSPQHGGENRSFPPFGPDLTLTLFLFVLAVPVAVPLCSPSGSWVTIYECRLQQCNTDYAKGS